MREMWEVVSEERTVGTTLLIFEEVSASSEKIEVFALPTEPN
jgi:hypothetical protein